MKRVFSVMLAGVVVCSLFAGCNSQKDATTNPSQSQISTQPTTTAPQHNQSVGSALEALESVWNLFAEEEKFWVVGGDTQNAVENAPGAVALKATDYLTTTLLIPQAQLGGVTEAASMVHAMNSNNFTCGVYKVADLSAFADAMKNALQNHQWICGSPELLKIVDLGGGYVLVAFGVGDAINPFFQKLATAHPQAKTLFDENVA